MLVIQILRDPGSAKAYFEEKKKNITKLKVWYNLLMPCLCKYFKKCFVMFYVDGKNLDSVVLLRLCLLKCYENKATVIT